MSIANELITRGWYQGDYEGPDGSVCLYGAAWKASGIESLEAWEREGAVRVGSALRMALREQCKGRSDVAMFNDDPTRTFDEVLRVAKHADEILGA